ncbi:hypothetical protein [Streptomyces sp. NPDC048106]|uniref:hypothetical protein n=1 Tax=Streptomyces sp. NPDC048106 TaxID=3155750 RepID=UPI0034521DBF
MTVAHDVAQAVFVLLGGEHGRSFPTRAANAGLLDDLTITHSGRQRRLGLAGTTDPERGGSQVTVRRMS